MFYKTGGLKGQAVECLLRLPRETHRISEKETHNSSDWETDSSCDNSIVCELDERCDSDRKVNGGCRNTESEAPKTE